MTPIVEMATEETTPSEALAVMLERHYRHMPIVDDHGKVLGICSIRNILEARVDDLLAQLDSSTPQAGSSPRIATAFPRSSTIP